MTGEFKVISGSPTTTELAVVAAVLSRLGGIKEIPEPSKLTKWGDPHAHMRHRLAINGNAWRQSAWAKH